MKLGLGVIVIATVLPLAVGAADEPFAGKWRLNQSKSKFTGQSDSIAAAGPDTWKFTYGVFSWTVKADGTDQPTPFNTTVALTAEGDDKWKLVNKVNGKVTSTETWTLDRDGATMTRFTTGTRQNGEHFESTTTMKRVAPGNGFEGTWQSTKLDASSPGEVIVEPAAHGGVTINIPANKVKYTVTFDGKECPASGPSVPPDFTISGTRPNPREAHMVIKINGKVVGTEDWQASPDGKTFTLTEHDPGVPAATIAVYDRQ